MGIWEGHRGYPEGCPPHGSTLYILPSLHLLRCEGLALAISPGQ